MISLLVLASIGGVLSVYYIHHYQQAVYGFSAERSFCNINSFLDCDSLQYTQAAAFLGTPIGAWALLYFLTYIYFLMVFYRHPQKWSFWILQILAVCGLVSAGTKAIVALWVYRKLCLTCAAGWVVLTALWVGTWRFIRPASTDQSAYPDVASLGKHSIIWLLILTVSVVIVPNLMMASQEKTIITNAKQIIEQKLSAPPQTLPEGILLLQHPDGDYAKGNLDAPITIVTFHDYECPVCGRQSEVFKRLLVRFPKYILFVIKNFPLDHHCNPNVTYLMHQTACYWAEVARCIGHYNSDAYWQFYDVYNRKRPKDSFSEIADQLPIAPSDKIQQCVDAHGEVGRIQTDIAHGQALYVSGTPTFFINGYRFEGYVPYYVLEQFIHRLLAKN